MPDEARSSPQKPPLHIRLCRGFGRVFLAICLAGVLLTWWEPQHWLLRGAAFFVPAYGPLLVLGLVLCALGRSWKWLGLGIACVIALLPLLATTFLAARPQKTVEANLSILQANLYVKNDDPQPLLDLVEHQAPQLLLFQEEDDVWTERLRPLEESYYYHLVVPRYANGTKALGIYSKFPIDEVEDLSAQEIPAVSVRLHVGPETVRVINVHTASPWSPRRALRHDNEMAALATYLADLDEPVIMAGDLNATPWHRVYKVLLEKSGLLPARRGIAGTWPSILPWIGVPLDHTLVSPSLPVLQSGIAPGIGSDHRPVVTDLQIPGGGAPADRVKKRVGEAAPPPLG